MYKLIKIDCIYISPKPSPFRTSGRVAYPGGVDPDPTVKKKPDPDLNLADHPDPQPCSSVAQQPARFYAAPAPIILFNSNLLAFGSRCRYEFPKAAEVHIKEK